MKHFKKRFSKKSNLVKLGNDSETREIIFKIITLLLFLTLGTRMFYLQIFQYKKYVEMSEENRIKLRRIEPERGKIYDRTGKVLVTNGTGFRLIYLKERKNDDETIEKISKITGFDAEFIKKRIKYGELSTYTRENVLVENLEEKLAHRIIEKTDKDTPIKVEIYSKRKYIYDNFASHIIGYVKKISDKEFGQLKDEGYTQRDIIGKNGLEKQYDSMMRGIAGAERIEVNAYNRLSKKIDKRAPINGENLYLSISYELQSYMEQVLKDEGLTGAVVTINPKTGNLITMVSYPTYSLETFSSQISPEEWKNIITDKRRPLNNKATAGEYPPGSIYKPISAFSFLSKGVDPQKEYFDPGYYEVGNWKWKAWKAGGHGYVNMTKSIVESVNPYYYRFADLYGYKSIYEYADMFGLGKATGIDLPGEKKGVNPNPEWKRKRFRQSWYKGDSINMSIGQGYVSVTPLQMLQVYCVLANKGYAYKPKLLKEIGEERKSTEKEVAIKIDLPQWYYTLMDEALRKTVADDNGTTKIMRTAGINIGAKSGSAQNAQSKETHAWVSGYFPMENPEVVFVVLLEGAGGGGKVAGGVAKKFVDKYYELKNSGKFSVD
ncbi:MAG: penicillin-binding protein 2 [Fusobacteriaceae bacterium]